MSANSALVKFKMVNGLISSILEESGLSLKSLFPKLPPIDIETKSKIEKLLESRERIKSQIEDTPFDDFTDDLNLANYFLACRKFAESLKYYESALVKNPQSYSALCNKGLCLYNLSQLDDAIACYDESLKIYHNIPEAFFMKGKILLSKQKTPEAINQFHHVLDLEPENIEAKYYLAKSLLKSNNVENAIKILDSIVEDNDHVDSLLLLGKIAIKNNDSNKALTYLTKLLDTSPNNIDAHLFVGKIHMNAKITDEAFAHFEKILELSPNNINAHLLLGQIEMDANNTDQALVHFEKILEISPNHMDALNFKIILLEKLGKVDEAIKFCEQFAASLPDPTEQVLKKGILLFNSNRTNEALANFNEILGKSNNNKVALLYKAKIFTQKQEFQEALSCIDIIFKSDSDNIDALECAFDLSLKVGNYENALSYINHILLQMPHSKSFLEKKSQVLSILGCHEESGQIYMELLQQDKTNVPILCELGKIHLILHNYEKAVDFFDGALRKKPFDSNIIYKKSLAFFSQQKYDASILCLEKISETDPLYDYAQYQKSKIQMIRGNTKQSMEILSKIIKSNNVFKYMASNEILFESISDTYEFKELIK